MDRVLNKDEIEAQLRGKSETITRRIDALQHEVTAAPQAVKDAILKNPWVAVGGTLAVGLVIGLVIRSGRRGGYYRQSDSTYRALVDAYVDRVTDEVRYAASRGKEAGVAVREALADRVPLIVYALGTEAKQGFFAQSLDLAVKTALGFAVKAGLDFASAKLNLAGLIEGQAAQEPVKTPAAAPVVAAVTEA